jgi:hypothetical protein
VQTIFFSTAAGNIKTRWGKADRHQNAACAWEAGLFVSEYARVLPPESRKLPKLSATFLHVDLAIHIVGDTLGTPT